MIRKYVRSIIAFIVVLTLISGGYLLAQRITKTTPNYDAGIAAYQRGHYHAALYDFESRANQGDKVAQFCLAYMLKHGKGVIEPKPNEALKWYKKAADQGYPPATNNLGFLYVRRAEATKSQDLEMQNLKIAEKWFKLAAERNYPPSQFNLSIIDFNKYEEWLITAAVKHNYARAQNQLYGVLSQLHNKDRNKISFEDSLKMLRMAAEKGYSHAQNALGLFYAEGLKGERNHEEAIKWYEKAAKQGSLEACFNLGQCYNRGDGVNQNLDKAIEYYLLAAKRDNIDAQNGLGVVYWEKHRKEKDKDKVLSDMLLEMSTRWFIRAAQQDDPLAQLNIGKYFDIGVGNVAQDIGEAYFWYSLALRNQENRKVLEDAENNHSSISNEYKSKDRVAELLDDPGEISEINKRIENWKPKFLDGSGTGFYIDKNYIITNAHVVLDENGNELDEFRIPYRRVELVAWDQDVDLALLYDERGSSNIATFRESPVRFGENVTVFGYPQSHLLSYEGNIAPGTVSGTSFIVNHPQFRNRFQYTAPTQGGNSGGPVFDSEGKVVGISVSGLLDYRKFITDEPSIGDSIPQYINISQNINFAIKADVVEKFISNAKAKLNLDDSDFPAQTRFGLGIDRDDKIQKSITLPEQRAQAKKFTVPVICYKNKAEPPLGVVEIRIEELEQ